MSFATTVCNLISVGNAKITRLYSALFKRQLTPSIITDEKNMTSNSEFAIDLPHLGADAHIDLVRLVDYCMRQQLGSLGADNDRQHARKQYLDLYRKRSIEIPEIQIIERFENKCCGSLEPIIRNFFAPNVLPLETQIVTDHVISELVKTKIFTASTEKFDLPFFVNSLVLDREKGEDFLKDKEKTSEPIPENFWKIPANNFS
ncbi:hypothetical protein JFT60_25540 [Pseudomonas sp. MF6772]|uniref:hypothetical protein n=1 Tax=Pseudomonas sp. MF6772 TaxID=2797533 RepID=UPI0018E71D59|nr:hypothetical protein [Pseudomonas sp. MF6772]MBJ2270745.1 hypothetical protein [Pseudomonas sp. MF6772]